MVKSEYVSRLSLFIFHRWEKASLVLYARARTPGTIRTELDPEWNHNNLLYCAVVHKHKHWQSCIQQIPSLLEIVLCLTEVVTKRVLQPQVSNKFHLILSNNLQFLICKRKEANYSICHPWAYSSSRSSTTAMVEIEFLKIRPIVPFGVLWQENRLLFSSMTFPFLLRAVSLTARFPILNSNFKTLLIIWFSLWPKF